MNCIHKKICFWLLFIVPCFFMVKKLESHTIYQKGHIYQKHVEPILVRQEGLLLSHREFAELLKKYSVEAIPFEETKKELAHQKAKKRKQKKRGIRPSY